MNSSYNEMTLRGGVRRGEKESREEVEGGKGMGSGKRCYLASLWRTDFLDQ